MDAWRDMRKEGIKMNTVVYNAVIDAQARVGAMDEVSELVEKMGADRCQPDVITHSTIVKGYCVKGDLDKAFEVFGNMQKNNMASDNIIYNTVLDGCTRHGRMDLADKLLEDMERFGVAPSNFTLGILVKMYGRRRQLQKAFEVVESLPRRYNFMINAQVRTCLMCACLNNGEMDKAFKVFEDMKSKGPPDGKAYAALVSGCVRHGQLVEAVRFVEEAYGLGPKGAAAWSEPKGRQQASQAMDLEPVEQLLRALQQRGLMELHGVDLINKLRAAKIGGTKLYASVLGSSGALSEGRQPRNGAKGTGSRR